MVGCVFAGLAGLDEVVELGDVDHPPAAVAVDLDLLLGRWSANEPPTATLCKFVGGRCALYGARLYGGAFQGKRSSLHGRKPG